MSKSKKNTIDPEIIIKNYGADSVRLFILSDSPPEKDVQWSEQGIQASYKFIQKLWLLHQKIIKKVQNKNRIDNPEIKDEGPGIEKTSICFFLHSLTNKYPGSLIQGVPASVTRAILLPDSNSLIILTYCFDSFKLL